MIDLHARASDFGVRGFRVVRGFSWIACLLCALFFVSSVRGSGRGSVTVVVAVRYMQEEGTSHAHLYLYGESGKLQRQLTNDDTYQDSDPFFSPDGKTIVFTREADGKNGVWSIDPEGAGLQQLPEAPDWYKQAWGSNSTDSDSLGKPVPASDAYQGADGLAHYRLPDGSAELIAQESADPQNPGATYFLKDLKTGEQSKIASASGFVLFLLPVNTVQQSHILFEPPLNLAFILERLNSTDGSMVLALDLKTHQIHELTRSAAESENSPPPPIEVDPASPMPGEGAFLAITKVRFVPFGSGKKTANSSYLERYDHQLRIIRYAHEGAALFYGGSVYRTGVKPNAIWIPRASADIQVAPLAAAAPQTETVPNTPGDMQNSTPPAAGPDDHNSAVPVTNPIPMDDGVWMFNPTLNDWTWANIDGWQYIRKGDTWKWNGEGSAPSSHPATPHQPPGGFPNPPPPGAGGASQGGTGTDGIVLYTPGGPLNGNGNLQGSGGVSQGSGGASPGGTGASTGTDGIVLYTPGASLSGTGNLQGSAVDSSGTGGIVLYTPGASLSGTANLQGSGDSSGGGTSLYTPGASLSGTGTSLYTPGASLYTPGASLYTAGIALTQGVEVKETPKVVKINLRGDILFDFDKSDIRQSAETTLGQIAKLILKYPKATVHIDGYTDSKGSDTYNLGLSDRRAASVKAWLVSRGVAEDIVSTRGWGAGNPVAPNTHPNGTDDPEGRQKNRRVEITVKKK